MATPIARAALVPLRYLPDLGLTPELLALPGALVSLVEAAPTHLLVMTDRLPAGAAARLLATPASLLLYGLPKGGAFRADPHAVDFPEPPAGSTVFHLDLPGAPGPLTVPRAAFRPVRSLIASVWAAEALPLTAAPGPPPLVLRLVRSARRAPASAAFVPAGALTGLDDRLDRLPEGWAEGTAFSLWREGAFLLAGCGRELPPCGGVPEFWRAAASPPATGDPEVHVQLGYTPDPILAPDLLRRALGARAGHHLFWLDTPVLRAVPANSFRPLERRAWRAARGLTPTVLPTVATPSTAPPATAGDAP